MMLTESQKEFIDSGRYSKNAFIGSRQIGRTEAIIRKALKHFFDFSDKRILILAPKQDMVMGIHRRCRELFDKSHSSLNLHTTKSYIKEKDSEVEIIFNSAYSFGGFKFKEYDSVFVDNIDYISRDLFDSLNFAFEKNDITSLNVAGVSKIPSRNITKIIANHEQWRIFSDDMKNCSFLQNDRVEEMREVTNEKLQITEIDGMVVIDPEELNKNV